MYFSYSCVLFLLIMRRPPRSTRTDTLLPYTTLCRSRSCRAKSRQPSGKSKVDGHLDFARCERVKTPETTSSPTPWSPHLARKFLYIIAAIILLVLAAGVVYQLFPGRSEEHTSELKSLLRSSSAFFCLTQTK